MTRQNIRRGSNMEEEVGDHINMNNVPNQELL